MSFFGKNIRKIRSIKKISQAEFASIFDLSRASIGSYEEGRAEPKIEIISKVAKYFSITIDELINKELTVNELYHFDVGNEPAFKTSTLRYYSIKKIPYISSNALSEYNDLNLIKSNESIEIPIDRNYHENLAIHIDINIFNSRPKFIHNQSTIIVSTQASSIINTDNYYLIKTKDTIHISKLNNLANQKFHIYNATLELITLNKEDMLYYYPIIQYIGTIPTEDSNSRIENLESQLNLLISKLTR